MKIKPVGSNMTELQLDDVHVLFSYETPVAACIFGEGFELGWDKLENDIEVFTQGWEEDYVWLGRGVQTDSNRSYDGKHAVHMELDHRELLEIQEDLSDILMDLFDPEEFGLWTILYCG